MSCGSLPRCSSCNSPGRRPAPARVGGAPRCACVIDQQISPTAAGSAGDALATPDIAVTGLASKLDATLARNDMRARVLGNLDTPGLGIGCYVGADAISLANFAR